MPRETLRLYPALDFVLVGEPDLTIRDLLDTLERKFELRSPQINTLFAKHDPAYDQVDIDNGGKFLGQNVRVRLLSVTRSVAVGEVLMSQGSKTSDKPGPSRPSQSPGGRGGRAPAGAA